MVDRFVELSAHELRRQVRRQVQEGGDANLRDADGSTLLHRAAHVGAVEEVRVLLKEGAAVEARDRYGNTPLAMAAGGGISDRLMRDMMNVNTRGDDVRGPRGYKDEPTVIQYGCTECLRILLEAGADVSARDAKGYSVLHHAVLNTAEDRVRLLLEVGAEPNNVTEGREGDDFNITLLWQAVRLGRLNTFRLLLEAGADPDIQDNHGAVALNAAAYKRESVFLSTLLHAGANPNKRDREDRTALHYAAGEGSFEHVRLLLEAGADPDPQEELGETPLLWTLMFMSGRQGADSSICAKLLLEAGADPHKKDESGNSPLTLARENYHETHERRRLIEAAADKLSATGLDADMSAS